MTFPRSNFIFHDSEGFEAGAVEELEKVKKFVDEKSKKAELGDQLHAIWWDIILTSARG